MTESSGIALFSAKIFNFKKKESLPQNRLFPVFPFYENEIDHKRSVVKSRIMKECTGISPNGSFCALLPSDIRLAFYIYDEEFFSGFFSRLNLNFSFEFSSKMTSSAGALHLNKRTGSMRLKLSTPVILGSFKYSEKEVMVNGIKCTDRLSAAMSVIEHEMIHAYEFITTGKSSCKSGSFMKLAHGYFGHTSPYHSLKATTNKNRIIRAEKAYPFSVGDRVRFFFRGQWFEGEIVRITKRATVRLLTFIKNSPKFYVPLELLNPVLSQEALSIGCPKPDNKEQS
jgi:hypothetical protein